jgi:hypothetical protein
VRSAGVTHPAISLQGLKAWPPKSRKPDLLANSPHQAAEEAGATVVQVRQSRGEFGFAPVQTGELSCRGDPILELASGAPQPRNVDLEFNSREQVTHLTAEGLE